jgi:hypothetical protein
MYKVIIVSILLYIPNLLLAGENDVDKSKHIEKTFKLYANTYVEILNKYGDIDIETWDNDSVKFEIEITAHSDKTDKLDEMLKLIKIDFNSNNSFVIVQTEWTEDMGMFKQKMMSINRKISNNSRYTINYKVKIPDNIDLNLENKFGNIYMSDYNGTLIIDLSYGDLRAHNLSNVKQLEVQYGKVKLNELSFGRINLSSVKSFSVEKSKVLDITSSSSEINIGSLNTLNLTSKHDEITIEMIQSFQGNISMTDIQIDSLTTNFRSTSKYGSINFKYVQPSCRRIDMDASKTDIEINYSKSFNSNADIIISENTNFSFNNSYVNLDSNVDTEGLYHSKGKINQGGETKLIIKCIDGYLLLNSK